LIVEHDELQEVDKVSLGCIGSEVLITGEIAANRVTREVFKRYDFVQ